MIATARALGFTGILVAKPNIHHTIVDSLSQTNALPPALMSPSQSWAYFDVSDSIDPKDLNEETIINIIKKAEEINS